MSNINTTRGVIGILTGGGDVPGLNPAIRAVTIRALREGYRMIGLRRGWAGLIDIVREKDYDNSNNFQTLSDNMGHANIDVTQNVYGKSWWEERVDAVTRAVEAVSSATENAEKAEAKPDQPETFSEQRVPLWVPQQEAKIASC